MNNLEYGCVRIVVLNLEGTTRTSHNQSRESHAEDAGHTEGQHSFIRNPSTSCTQPFLTCSFRHLVFTDSLIIDALG